MKNVICTALLGIFALAGCAGTPDKTPSAQDLFDRFVETAYGKEGMSAVSSVTTDGKLVIENFGVEAPISIKQMAPDYYVTEGELMGSKLTQGCKGDVCWEQQPGQSPRLVAGGQKAFMLQTADFRQWENISAYYENLSVVEPVADETSAKEPVYHKVRAVRANGEEDLYYFSRESGLLVGSQLNVDTPMGKMQVLVRLNDYRQYGPIMLPSETVQETSMATMRIVVEEVSFEPLSEEDFVVPNGL